MYPNYELQVWTHEGWEKVEGTETSNRPHIYDELRAKFDLLVMGAKPYSAHFVKGFGYRIARQEYDGKSHVWITVDDWQV